MLIDTLDSPLWYRVAELRPRLRPHVRVQRREANGQVWYMLIDPSSGRFHRLDRSAWELVGRINGRDTVQTLWDTVHHRLGEAAPSQHEAITLLSQMAQADLIAADACPDLPALLGGQRRRQRAKRIAAANPLAFRLPLVNPTRLLDRIAPALRWLFTPAVFLLWLLLVGAGAVLALGWAAPLGQALQAQATSPQFILTMWLAYPVVKGLHEMAHALAVRSFGGSVREMGVTLLMLTPVPYVDASAAIAFPQRHRRIAVSAVGVMVELALASLALAVWTATDHPGLREVALAVVLLCGLSTLLFNANPLMRFDGYFMLCDALEQPNLGPRADTLLKALLQRALGQRGALDGAAHSTGEALLLGAYGLASLAYRVVVSVGLVMWLHQPYPLLALALAVLLAFSLLLRPLAQGLGWLLWDARLAGHRARALSMAAVLAAAAVAGLGVLPAPLVTVQQGVVWLPDKAVLRAPIDGTLEKLEQLDDAAVAEGEPIATLQSLELRNERETAQAKAVRLDVEYYQAMLEDPTRAQRVAAERDALQAQLLRLDERVATLQLKAGATGRLVLPRTAEREGHPLTQGTELGYVLNNEPLLVKLALTEAQAALVRRAPPQVSVRLAGRVEEVLPAVLEREQPGATRHLPSAVLGSPAGGPIATDPGDREGRTALQPVTLLDIRVPGVPGGQAIGQRAWVRLEHPGEPLVLQWARQVRQLFLRSLGARP
ncbi:membrane-fusion protein [Burkholderiales bacterium JOSHI_001]|nr:membrane-fusion protein [Burkholderiales bacterium JOSHI_001]